MVWSSVIIEWANALGLSENRIDSAEGLVQGDFLNKLIDIVVPDNRRTISVSNLDGIIHFVKEIYPNFAVKLVSEEEQCEKSEEEKNKEDDCSREEEIIILVTLVLIQFSLGPQIIRCTELRQRMDKLSHQTQCHIRTFLGSFVDCPPSLVTRSMIIDSIQQVSCFSTPEKKINDYGPREKRLYGNILTPTQNSNHNESPYFRQATELSKMDKELKRLRLKLDLTLSEKADIETEMKETIEKLRQELATNVRELKSLQEAQRGSGEENGIAVTLMPGDRLRNKQSSQEELLREMEAMRRDECDCLQMRISVLDEELAKLRKQKFELTNQLSIYKINASEAESRMKILEEENLDLSEQLNAEKGKTIQLTLTCKEQENIISEFNEKNRRLSYEMTDDSLVAIVNTESLASELNTLQTKQLEEAMEASSKEIARKTDIINQLNATIEASVTQLNKLWTELFLTKEVYGVHSVSAHQCIERLECEISLLRQRGAEDQREIEELKSKLQGETLLLQKNAEGLKEIERLKNKLQGMAILQRQRTEGLKEIKQLRNKLQGETLLQQQKAEQAKEIEQLNNKLQEEVSLRAQMESEKLKEIEDLKNKYQSEISLHIQKEAEKLKENEELKNKLKNYALLRKCENEEWKISMNKMTEKVERLQMNQRTASEDFEKRFVMLKNSMKDKYNDHLSGVLERHEREMNALKEAALREKSSLQKEISELRSVVNQRRKSRSHDRGDAPGWGHSTIISPMKGSKSVEQIVSINPFDSSAFVPAGSIFKTPAPASVAKSSNVHGAMSGIHATLPRGPRTTSRAEPTESFGDFANNRLEEAVGTSDSPNTRRLSVLQFRNSLCPPHLKSSYPLETQVLDPDRYREQNIRNSDVCLQPRSSTNLGYDLHRRKMAKEYQARTE